MAIQHTDTSVHDINFFAPSYEDTAVSSSSEFNTKKKAYGGLYNYNGQFDIKNTDKYIKYYLMQGDKIKDTKQVDIIRDGLNGEQGDTGLTAILEPSGINLTPDRSGCVTEKITTSISFSLFQNASSVGIKSIALLNSIPSDSSGNPYYSVVINGSTVYLTVNKGFPFSSPTDLSYKLQFTVVSENDTSIEIAFVLNKVSKGTSLGRISYVPTGNTLTNVTYDKGSVDDDGNIETVTLARVYAFTNDVVVNIGTGNMADVYKYNGSEWVKVNDDVSACYSAFEDIMSVTDSTVSEVICKRLVAQVALINTLIAKYVRIKEGGEIRTGAFINTDGSDNDNPSSGTGVLINKDGVNVRGKVHADALELGTDVRIGVDNLSGLPSTVSDYQKIYKLVAKNTDGSYTTPAAPSTWIAANVTATTSVWGTIKASPSDGQLLFSCTQSKKYNDTNIYNTTVGVDSDTVIDTENGYLRTNLIDTDDLFAENIVMKKDSKGNAGSIETEDFDPDTSTKGFKLDGKAGSIICNNGSFKSIKVTNASITNSNNLIQTASGDYSFGCVAAGKNNEAFSNGSSLVVIINQQPNCVYGKFNLKVTILSDNTSIKGTLKLGYDSAAGAIASIAVDEASGKYVYTKSDFDWGGFGGVNHPMIEFVTSQTEAASSRFNMIIQIGSSLEKGTSSHNQLCECIKYEVYNNFKYYDEDRWLVTLKGDGTATAFRSYVPGATVGASDNYTYTDHQPIPSSVSDISSTTTHFYTLTPYTNGGAFTNAIQLSSVSSTIQNHVTYVFGNRNALKDAYLFKYDVMLNGEWCNTNL